VAEKQAAGVPEPWSPSQAMQVPAALQIGVLPEHSALDAHCTQVWLVSLHAAVGAMQSTWSSVVHCTHLPASTPTVTQAGFVVSLHALGEPEPRLPSHATHAPPALQIGVFPPQSVSARQP